MKKQMDEMSKEIKDNFKKKMLEQDSITPQHLSHRSNSIIQRKTQSKRELKGMSLDQKNEVESLIENKLKLVMEEISKTQQQMLPAQSSKETVQSQSHIGDDI